MRNNSLCPSGLSSLSLKPKIISKERNYTVSYQFFSNDLTCSSYLSSFPLLFKNFILFFLTCVCICAHLCMWTTPMCTMAAEASKGLDLLELKSMWVQRKEPHSEVGIDSALICYTISQPTFLILKGSVMPALSFNPSCIILSGIYMPDPLP